MFFGRLLATLAFEAPFFEDAFALVVRFAVVFFLAAAMGKSFISGHLRVSPGDNPRISEYGIAGLILDQAHAY